MNTGTILVGMAFLALAAYVLHGVRRGKIK
jgi:hypothetical protein